MILRSNEQFPIEATEWREYYIEVDLPKCMSINYEHDSTHYRPWQSLKVVFLVKKQIMLAVDAYETTNQNTIMQQCKGVEICTGHEVCTVQMGCFNYKMTTFRQ